MATTTNFGWETPDDTDLVKDGALAMRTLGNAIDASLVDLKGGTTGQVLSKASNTDLDYTWVTQDDANAIQNAIVDAKGDLITATAADTPARIAVGNNGETLVADSSTTTGLRWQSAFNGNAVINGGYDIWQRSTSATFAGTVAYPAADRWFAVSLGSSPTSTMSRQTADTTNLTYGMRFGRNSGQTATGDVYVGYVFESVDAKRFAGQTVTLSFSVKAGANAPTTLFSQIRTGTGTDQTAATLFASGWTGGANNSQTNTVTTTMTRYSQTVTLGSTVNQIMIAFAYTSTGTAGANEWFQIEGVQLEFGSVPTSFKRAGGTLAGELAACKRYLPSISVPSTSTTVEYFMGYAALTNTSIFTIPFDVQARVAPTGITISGQCQAFAGNTSTNVTPTYDAAGVNAAGLVASHTITQGQGARLSIPIGGSILFTGCEL